MTSGLYNGRDFSHVTLNKAFHTMQINNKKRQNNKPNNELRNHNAIGNIIKSGTLWFSWNQNILLRNTVRRKIIFRLAYPYLRFACHSKITIKMYRYDFAGPPGNLEQRCVGDPPTKKANATGIYQNSSAKTLILYNGLCVVWSCKL